MPRRAPTAQKVATPTGLPYGTGKESQDAQRAIPLPNNQAATEAAIAAGQQGAPADPAAGGAAANPLEAAIAAAMGGPSPGAALTAPSDRPGEPLTAGSPLGAGPGPAPTQARQQGSVADYFALAAQVFGNDPQLARMAQRARQRGL